MARPLSERKREALLAAAADLMAENGIGTSTAAIARTAGVAEGTLFTYFPTKDALFNALYVSLSEDLGRMIAVETLGRTEPRSVVAHILGGLIAWGVAHPTHHRAKAQLKTSERITQETRRTGHAFFRASQDRLEQALADCVDSAKASFLIGTVMPGLADLAVEAIRVDPASQGRLTELCIQFFWQGIQDQPRHGRPAPPA